MSFFYFTFLLYIVVRLLWYEILLMLRFSYDKVNYFYFFYFEECSFYTLTEDKILSTESVSELELSFLYYFLIDLVEVFFFFTFYFFMFSVIFFFRFMLFLQHFSSLSLMSSISPSGSLSDALS